MVVLHKVFSSFLGGSWGEFLIKVSPFLALTFGFYLNIMMTLSHSVGYGLFGNENLAHRLAGGGGNVRLVYAHSS